MNTASEIRIELTSTERHVRLDKGEAFFEVAKDPTRPFVVQAGRKRVIAVGTQFSVRRDGDDIRVAVTDGKVLVEDIGRSSASGPFFGHWEKDVPNYSVRVGGDGTGSADIRSGGVFLTPGNIASAGDGGIRVQEKPLTLVEDDLSWRSGYLVFRDTALADAIVEFNRYNERQIVIEDPKVAAIPVSGKFRSTNCAAFVRLLEQGFPVRARAEEGHIVLTDSHR